MLLLKKAGPLTRQLHKVLTMNDWLNMHNCILRPEPPLSVTNFHIDSLTAHSDHSLFVLHKICKVISVAHKQHRPNHKENNCNKNII